MDGHMKEKTKRCWIAERCSRARKTLIVYASSRAEAQSKLDAGESNGVEGVDVTYYNIGRAKIIREERRQ
jgi:hypothetical protein